MRGRKRAAEDGDEGARAAPGATTSSSARARSREDDRGRRGGEDAVEEDVVKVRWTPGTRDRETRAFASSVMRDARACA